MDGDHFNPETALVAFNDHQTSAVTEIDPF
jgi:hypothetical protein